MRVLVSEPFGLVGGYFIPEPVSQVGVEEATWMETIAGFNHILRHFVLEDSAIEDFEGWEVVIDEIVVFEGMALGDDLFIDVGQFFCPSGGLEADCMIGIEPTCTGTDLQTIQEVIKLIVFDVQRMEKTKQIISQQISISQSKNDHMTSLRQCCVKPFQKFQDILFEFVNRRISMGVTATDIISNQFQKKQNRMVILLISMQCFDVPPRVAGVTAVDPDILEIVVITEIPFPQFFVDRMGQITCIGVTCVGRFVWEIQFIGYSCQQVVKGSMLHHAGIEEFWRN